MNGIDMTRSPFDRLRANGKRLFSKELMNRYFLSITKLLTTQHLRYIRVCGNYTFYQ